MTLGAKVGCIAAGLSLALACCAAAPEAPVTAETLPSLSAAPARAEDDGNYRARIDPLGGQWQIATIGTADMTRHKAWIGFSDGGFLNHGAGCGGGYPAFYKLDGARLRVTRIEAVRIGPCKPSQDLASAPQAVRDAAIASERTLAAFVDALAGWRKIDADTLELTARDGRVARLTRPVEPHPDLAGRWLIERIGGAPFATERRPAVLTIAMGSIGAQGDCNSFGTEFSRPAPGRLAMAGPIVSTLIGCAPEDQAEDGLMARAITGATGYQLDGERLMLTGGPGMELRRPPPPNRRLAGQYEACGNTPLGAYTEGAVTLDFGRDTIRDNAGCTARYRADGPDLTLELDASAACAATSPPFVPGQPVGVGGTISPLAVMRPDGFAFTDEGQLLLRAGRGTLTLCRKGDPPAFGSG